MNTKRVCSLIAACFALILLASASPAHGQSAATFVRSDSGTQGNWKNVYGTQGVAVADTTANSVPSYATFTPEGQATYTWTNNGTEARDMQVAWSSPVNQRQASCWYTTNSGYDLNVNFTDGNTHQFALYALDWDYQNRGEQIQIVDATSNAVLDTRTISNFTTGIYLVWNIKGHVRLNVTVTGGQDAVASAVFFDPAAALSTGATSTASFVKNDGTTIGNWHGVYGADGYSIPNDSQKTPSYGTLAVQNQTNYTWNANPTNPTAPQNGANTGRIASTWYSASNFLFDVNLTDGKTHQVGLYALDWDSYQGIRTETVQVLDATTGAVLDSRSSANFTGGVYFLWNVTGHVKVKVINNFGGTAVISGIFFDTAKGSGAASFVSSDTSTQGNWRTAYGADGFSIPNSTQSLPSYAAFAVQNQTNYTWANNTTDLRATQLASGSGRIAATWYSNSTFNFDLNITDGQTHQVALYALDWDVFEGGRSETIQIVDAVSNAVLDSKSISGFTNGMYMVWNISGHVKINLSFSAGNAVISGIFFGKGGSTSTGSLSNAAPIVPVTTTTTPTQPTSKPGILSANFNTLNLGSVTISGTGSQTVSLSNTGASSLAITNVSVGGAGFNASGVPTGTTLTPGQTITLTVTFSPAAAGNMSGSVMLASTASNSTLTIPITGTGTQPAPVNHSVVLNWTPSSSSNISGYDVYRGTTAGGPYALLTSSPVSSSSFTDTTAQGGQTYYYVVTSVSGSTQSAYSNVVSVTIP